MAKSYEVYFYDPEQDCEVLVHRTERDSDAIHFAVALHDSSNVEHSVLVRRGSDNVCSLVREAELVPDCVSSLRSIKPKK